MSHLRVLAHRVEEGVRNTSHWCDVLYGLLELDGPSTAIEMPVDQFRTRQDDPLTLIYEREIERRRGRRDAYAPVVVEMELWCRNPLRGCVARKVSWGGLLRQVRQGEVLVYPLEDGGWSCFSCSLRDRGAPDPTFVHAADASVHLGMHALENPSCVPHETMIDMQRRAGRCDARTRVQVGPNAFEFRTCEARRGACAKPNGRDVPRHYFLDERGQPREFFDESFFRPDLRAALRP